MPLKPCISSAISWFARPAVKRVDDRVHLRADERPEVGAEVGLTAPAWHITGVVELQHDAFTHELQQARRGPADSWENPRPAGNPVDRDGVEVAFVTPKTPRTPEQHFARYRDAGDLASLAAVFDAVAGNCCLSRPPGARRSARRGPVQTTSRRGDAVRRALRRAPAAAAVARQHPDITRKLCSSGCDATGAGRRAVQDEPSAADRGARPRSDGGGSRPGSRLEPSYRHVLTLRLVHDLSPAAIAHSDGMLARDREDATEARA